MAALLFVAAAVDMFSPMSARAHRRCRDLLDVDCGGLGDGLHDVNHARPPPPARPGPSLDGWCPFQ
jgi:hypothetical protein